MLWNQVVALWIEVACPEPELEGKAGPERRVVPVSIEIPTGAPGGPDGAAHAPLHLHIERLLNSGPYLDSPHVPPIHCAQAVQDIVDLRFDHVDHRIMTQAGVWADEQEQVGKP